MQIDLDSKVAVVTGGSGELGRVICRTLAQCGAAVAVHFHSNQAKADRVVGEIIAQGGKAAAFQADITRADQVQQLKAAVEARLGPAGIIVTNAVSQIHPWSSVLEESVEDYQDQFNSCVLQNVLMAKAFVPAMIEKKWGRVIGINTECSTQLFPNYSAYGSAKRAMDGVLRVLAREVGQHQITVNQVAPGWMISDKYRENGTESQPDYERNVPLRRRGKDQDIANAVAFLASDLAEFITGVYLPVCGGNVMPAI